MKRLIPTLAIAAALATGVHAQDSKTTTRTQVKADDAKAITATGCLVAAAPGAFALRGAITARGEEVTTKTRTKTEVDRDESRTRTESRTRADGDHDRVGHADVVVYDLTPRAGVNLARHVGQQVQMTAILLDRGKGDADVKVKEETRVENQNAPDARSRTESKITVDRGDGPRLNVISVKPLGQSCS
jgi:Rieske Fe-S protein